MEKSFNLNYHSMIYFNVIWRHRAWRLIILKCRYRRIKEEKALWYSKHTNGLSRNMEGVLALCAIIKEQVFNINSWFVSTKHIKVTICPTRSRRTPKRLSVQKSLLLRWNSTLDISQLCHLRSNALQSANARNIRSELRHFWSHVVLCASFLPTLIPETTGSWAFRTCNFPTPHLTLKSFPMHRDPLQSLKASNGKHHSQNIEDWNNKLCKREKLISQHLN